MKSILTLLIVLTSLISFGQTEIKGQIIDEQGMPFSGANVFVIGTYDGTTSNENGNFSFTTTASGNQKLQISFLSYETIIYDFVVETFQSKVFTIKESLNTLNAVEVTAGTFKAGDNSKATALKAMDIVTTAGSAGNIISALETLPGTQTIGENGRLFVRGGEADETQTYVDGIRVGQPYGASANNVPTRGRFSPFLFSGITFSTGGYSAEFGDALSSVLLLNTIDEPTQNQTDISIMTVGVGLGKTKKWEKSSFTFNTSYINLAPYQLVVPQNLDWNKPYETLAGESVFRYKFKNGILKVYGAFDYSTFDLNQKDVNFDEKIRFDLQNNNFYFNTSYKGYLNDNLQLQTGFSYGYAQNKIGISADKVANNERTLHTKFKLRNSFSNRFKLSVGADLFHTNFDENFNVFGYGYQNNSIAFFSEAEVLLSRKVAFNVGLRSSNASIVDEFKVEPRISFAYKVAENSQFSMAYGNFNQTAKQDYLKFNSNLDYETTSHYILNYMYNKQGRMFRVEAYFKDYKNLVKYDGTQANFDSNYNNDGFGYAKGLDLFWRDSKTIKNLDYWISYSFIDSERDFRNYETQVTPSFVANHNFSLVTKYFVSKWKSQISATYSYNSGRPYDNPNVTEFMSKKTKSFNNLSFSWAYLLSQQRILFFSVTNVLGTENIFGYQYAITPTISGQFQRQAITQAADRFIFVGLFWTISDNKKTNNLDNL
ncbi:TonB-dependent receptor plug domain-containing protein [Flavobacterium sp. LMO8]|uniref:TonB-dependent receptor n=1 Tax=Flavobacterium sp. LMO8 TaxID=2654244 RepID=UPI001291D64B|nr:TonB-dependent receptor [Flavobacterium sp. LMO8]MQP24116.1 TonB-dependent receptor plug domain-containing protein [Flavobacterium sp. LMO8]